MNWLLCLITGYLRRNESKKVGPGTIKGEVTGAKYTRRGSRGSITFGRRNEKFCLLLFSTHKASLGSKIILNECLTNRFMHRERLFLQRVNNQS